jgi:protein-tyrosine phosphatase
VRLDAGALAYRSDGVIDLHCHVLPGIDDGPETIEGSVALARTAIAAGIRTVVATPHVSWRYPNDPDTISRLVGEVNARLLEEGLELEVRPGGELARTHLPEIEPELLTRFGLGGGSWLLVEPPFTAVATGLDAIVQDLLRRGHRVVLAHPERCQGLRRDPGMLQGLAANGVLMSITADSLTGRFGSEVRRFSLELARDGMVHNVASDAHDDVQRPPGILDALEQAGLRPLADWLTREVPAAILADERIPARPAGVISATAPRRRFWQRKL